MNRPLLPVSSREVTWGPREASGVAVLERTPSKLTGRRQQYRITGRPPRIRRRVVRTPIEAPVAGSFADPTPVADAASAWLAQVTTIDRADAASAEVTSVDQADAAPAEVTSVDRADAASAEVTSVDRAVAAPADAADAAESRAAAEPEPAAADASSTKPPAAVKEKGLLHYLGTAISAALLLLVLGIAVLVIVLPTVVGGQALTVLTQSMEPGLPPGTLIVIKPTPVDDIRIGDVLTYQIASDQPAVVSHRVITKSIGTDGETTFTTKGDNNDLADQNPVREVQIRGTLWYSIPYLGWVNNAVNGDARMFVVPIAAGGLFLYALYMFGGSVRDRIRKRRVTAIA